MLATFAFDVCHDVYRAAREAIDTKIPTLNAESSGKYQWRPDRMPRLAEYVCDFARAGERALGVNLVQEKVKGRQAEQAAEKIPEAVIPGEARNLSLPETQRKRDSSANGAPRNDRLFSFSAACEAHPTYFRASRMAMFRVYYLGGAEYQAARRHLGISELTWADWAEEIRRLVGNELARAGVFPPSKYFRESTKKAS